MYTKIKLFLIISIFSFVSIKGMSLNHDEANQRLLKAAHAKDYSSALEAVSQGARLDFLEHKGQKVSDFTLELIFSRANIYDKIKEDDILRKINQFLESEVQKDTGLMHDLVNIIFEYEENPLPKSLSDLNGLSIEKIHELIHFYEYLKHAKEKHIHCLIM